MRAYEEKQLADWLTYSNEALPALLRRKILVRCDEIETADGPTHRKVEMDLKGELGEKVKIVCVVLVPFCPSILTFSTNRMFPPKK